MDEMDLRFRDNAYRLIDESFYFLVHRFDEKIIIIDYKEIENKLFTRNGKEILLPLNFVKNVPQKTYKIVNNQKTEIIINNQFLHYFTDQFDQMYCISRNLILPLGKIGENHYYRYQNFPKIHTKETCPGSNFSRSTTTFINQVTQNIFDTNTNLFYKDISLSFCKHCEKDSSHEELLVNKSFFKLTQN